MNSSAARSCRPRPPPSDRRTRSARTSPARPATSVQVCFQSSRDLAPLAHVVGDDEQDRGEHRQRHVGRRAARRTAGCRAACSAWIIPATGVCAPERMLVAVRAIAPVAGSPPNSGDTMLATPCANSSTFGVVPVAAHAIGDDRRQQRLDRAEHRHRQRRREQRQDQVRAELRHVELRQAGRNAAEARADRLDVETEQQRDDGAARTARRCSRARAARSGSTR